MKFDTLLKLGTHAAKIVQHDAFQEMSKMIHKGVKRRMQVPEQQGQQGQQGQHSPVHPHPWHWHSGTPLPPYRHRTGPLPPYGNTPQRSQANPSGQIKNLLTPDNLNAARQLIKVIADRGNSGGNKDQS
jgi:hypothetical protein